MTDFKSLISDIADAKKELNQANQRVKDLKAIHDDYQDHLIQALKENGLDKVSAAGYTASHNIETVASVKDWESFYEYVKEHDAFFLLQKRVASAAYRELLQVEGVAPPGTEPVEKDKLSFTRL